MGVDEGDQVNYGASRRSQRAPEWESIRLPPGDYVVRLGVDGETAAIFAGLNAFAPIKVCGWPRAAAFVQSAKRCDLDEPLCWEVTVGNLE